jgi:site-specific DNA-methyltransferase (adenine-specific)
MDKDTGLPSMPDAKDAGRRVLAIVDPPYGIGEDGLSNHSRGGRAKATLYTPKNWDNSPPDKTYFNELRRVSHYQIIWGANHFISRLPYDSPCWVVWDKQNGCSDFADCELAWTNFKTAVRITRFKWSGMLQGNMKQKESRIHPTQKPVALYRWLLENYAQPGDLILDTHVGSASSLIACEQMGFDYIGWEKDADYYAAAKNRMSKGVQGLIKFE